jgi:hypothetical protein
MNRIPTTDNRLIRRIIRDYKYRGYSALDTIRRWDSVRRGEDKNIFPYQEQADVMFNSALLCELSVLKSYAEQIERIKFKRQMTNNQRNSLLEFSLENKLLQYVAEIITYLSLDVEENTEWKRVFKSYEEFRNYIGDELVIKSGMYSMFLQYL